MPLPVPLPLSFLVKTCLAGGCRASGQNAGQSPPDAVSHVNSTVDMHSAANWTRPTALQRPAAVIHWLTLVGIAVALGVLVLGATVMLQARAEAWRQARQLTDNLALALERDIARNIAVYDLSLQGAAEVLATPGVDQLSPALRRAAIFDRAASAEDLGAMLVLDAAGRITASSTTEQIKQTDLTDRDYFVVHRDHPDAGLYVSRPFRSRMRHGEPTVVLSRRLTNSDGSFAGVVLGALNVAYFDHLFSKLDVGQGGVVSLLRMDGHMVARSPSTIDVLDRDLSESEPFHRMLGSRAGNYVGSATVDGTPRLYSFRQVGNLPLMINVGLATAGINASWIGRSFIIGGLLGLLCLAMLTLSVFFRREILRRLAAEAALAERAETLAVLATTDGLTGLNNRMAFEGELTRAWRHGVRSKASVAVLMLDADCFKRYNDQYGHLAGDRVLRSIAACIVGNIHRPLDFAARYGGEEFVILLPETSVKGAMCVAEAIRSAVASLAIPHDGSPSGVVTISIGVATNRPVELDAEHAFLQEADQALYQSKERGRNCVTAATMAAWPAALEKELA